MPAPPRGPVPGGVSIRFGDIEVLACLFMARVIFKHCQHMRFEGYMDNLGAVYMLNTLTSRSANCRKMVNDILWLATAYDVEIAYQHVPTAQHSSVYAKC